MKVFNNLKYMILAPLSENYQVTQKFWERPQYYKQFGLKSHDWADYWCPIWTPVFASFDWIIELWDQGKTWYWKYIVLTEQSWDSRRQCLYAHLSKIQKNNWDIVKAWEQIGLSGNTGNSTGAHLHFSFRRIDKDWNIINYNNGWHWREDIFWKWYFVQNLKSKY